MILADPSAWGLAAGYHDAFGRWTDVPEATLRAVITAMGGDPDRDEPPPDPWDVWVVRQGAADPLQGPVVLELEDGTTLEADGHLPPDLPLGYHDLHHVRGGAVDAGVATRLVVAPPRAHPAPSRAWGWAVQLYALRSRASWGLGDLADLRVFGRQAAASGAEVVLVNPLDAVTPVQPRETSPYYPSTRLYRDPIYLRVEDVPGAELVGGRLDGLALAGRALNDDPTIDRDRVYAHKLAALEEIWSAADRARGDPDLTAFREREGAALERFATFCTLAEHHGTGWRSWPAAFHDPAGEGVRAFREATADRVRFHVWLQWLLDRQLREAGGAVGLLRDLPVGFDPDGADAWAWQDVLAPEVSIGAPPDQLGPRGQDWQLPPFVPWRLRAARYEPLVHTLRSAFRHAAGLRIDHVLGLFRQFWIPSGASPAEGAYVRFPARELLDIVALESHRAGAFVVGEDLGTVEDGVRDELRDRGMLRYQVLLFEDEPPETWAEQALASATTHDLPTLAGLWSSADATELHGLGLTPDEAFVEQVRSRLVADAGVPRDASPDAAVAGAHRLLARAPATVVVAQIEDALAVPRRTNVPGTTTAQRDNWSRALPMLLEDLVDHPGVAATVEALAGR